ncbi:hypothetical protein DV736_g920, partial [Chaetothyriales sp. CBS 134916]
MAAIPATRQLTSNNTSSGHENAVDITPQQRKFRTRIGQALESGNLTVVIGAGVSISAIQTSNGTDTATRTRAVESMSWLGLLRHGLAYLTEEGIPLTDEETVELRSHQQQLGPGSPTPSSHSVLHAASFLKRKLTESRRLNNWFDLEFEGIYEAHIKHDPNPMLDAIRSLYQGGARIITTNYDDLVDKHIQENAILDDTTPASKLFFRKKMKGVYHVHGVWWHTKGAIFDSMDYDRIARDDTVQQGLKNIMTGSEVLLFVGTGGGLDDPNFGKLLAWVAQWNEDIAQTHCLLARCDDQIDRSVHGLNILRYGNSYDDLPVFLTELASMHKYTLSKPIFHVPFNKMSGFVGRTDEFQKVKAKLSDRDYCPRISLLGLGGVGKSRLALELAHQIKSEHAQYSVIWIQAENLLTFEEDILQIGKKLGIPGIDDAKADVKALVRQRLQNQSEEKWLLILDNADDEMLWGRQSDPNKQEFSLAEYLPRTLNGSILVTTRSRRVATFLTGKEFINLAALSPHEAIEMFTNGLESAYPAGDRTALETLVEKLTHLPLAIVQASAFINRTQCSVHDYLELLDQPEDEVIELLSQDFGDQSRYHNARNPIAITWLISFQHIHQHHPLAVTFLSSMACLHEKAIPLSILPQASSKIQTMEAIGVLTGYSFVQKRAGGGNISDIEELYDVHRLVQLAARNWLKTEAYNNLGEALIWKGYYSRAETYLQQAVKGQKELSGPEDSDTLTSMANLASTYRNQGRWTQAEELEVQVMETRKRVLRAEHPSTLTSMANLASTFWNQGRWTQAEELFIQVIETRKRVLGAEHPDTLTSMANLASTYRNQGRWTQAEELEVQVMETRKRVLGAEHPSTLTSMANLASTYRNQGRWTQAEELFVQVMDTRKRVLGAEHPDTLTSMANLASTFWNQGRWTQAEELEVQVIETRKRVLGAEHPDTLTSMANLASTYQNQGRWTQAEDLEVQVMETRKRVLGAEHPSTLTSMANLASTFWNQGRWTQAEELFVQVIETSSRVLGAEHPSTLTSIANLALTYQNQGRWTQAEDLEVQVMETRKRVLGAEHPDTLTSMANLASTYRNQGRWTQAEELEAQVMETRKRVLRAEHPDTLTSMANLASTFWNQGRWTQAEELEVQVMETRKRVLGAEHPDTLTSMANLASTFWNQGRWTQAEELFVQVMETSSRVLGAEHPDTLTSIANLALTYQNQGRWTQAEELEVQVMETRKR